MRSSMLEMALASVRMRAAFDEAKDRIRDARSMAEFRQAQVLLRELDQVWRASFHAYTAAEAAERTKIQLPQPDPISKLVASFIANVMKA